MLLHYKYLDIALDERTAVMRLGASVGPEFLEEGHPMHRELASVWRDLAENDDVHSVVITGSGGVFFTGPPLEAMNQLLAGKPEVVIRQMRESAFIVSELLNFSKPLVAAVNGPAISIGCQIAFLSDAAVASRTATFQDTHVRLGLVAGDGGTWLWPLLVGYSQARRILLRSHPLSASEAFELGLVVEVVDPDEVVEKALEIARKLERLPSFAFGSTKLALNQWLRLGALLSGDLSASLQMMSLFTPDYERAIERARQRLAKDAESPSGSAE